MGMAGIGSVLRDGRGNFIAGLAVNIGTAANIMAELWAIRDSLVMTRKKNISSIHIETDFYTVFQMLSRGRASGEPSSSRDAEGTFKLWSGNLMAYG